jgi:hypothetical protein
MEGYVTPTLNLVSFSFGFAMAMFWPIHVASGALAGWAAFRRRQTAIAWVVIALNLLPFATLAVVGWATERRFDIGSRDGAVAQTLDTYFLLALIAGPLAAVVLGSVMLARRLGSKGGAHAHS